MNLRRSRPAPEDPKLEHLAGLLATAIAEIRDCREAAREARDLAAEIHHLTVRQQAQPDTLAGVAADVKAARTAAESAFVATQALAAVAVKPAATQDTATDTTPAPAPKGKAGGKL